MELFKLHGRIEKPHLCSGSHPILSRTASQLSPHSSLESLTSPSALVRLPKHSKWLLSPPSSRNLDLTLISWVISDPSPISLLNHFNSVHSVLTQHSTTSPTISSPQTHLRSSSTPITVLPPLLLCPLASPKAWCLALLGNFFCHHGHHFYCYADDVHLYVSTKCITTAITPPWPTAPLHLNRLVAMGFLQQSTGIYI